MPSIKSKSFIFGLNSVFFSEEKMNSDPSMKLLLFIERTQYDAFTSVLMKYHNVIMENNDTVRFLSE